MQGRLQHLHDIALLVGVPCQWEEFRDWPTASDYLRKFALDPVRSWHRVYSPSTAQPLAALIERARQLGVTVRQCATLESLRDATFLHSIVIICSHWKGDRARSEDFICQEPAEFLARVARSRNAQQRWLRSRMADPHSGVHAPMARVMSAIAQFMDSYEPELDDVDASGFAVLADVPTVRSERRDRIDALFEGLINPGNRLELADGLHSRADVAAHVAPSFTGILDLSACHSSVLANHLNRQRGSDCHIVQFHDVQDLGLVAQTLLTTLNLMAEHHMPYLAARRTALEFTSSRLRSMLRPTQGVVHWLRRVLWENSNRFWN
jgi:hypothetical protein